jgi:pimeloyl-ACP methyl ester carboxylesterase
LTADLPPGPIEVTSRFGALAPVVQTLTPDDAQVVAFHFKHSYGTLIVSSDRADATLTIDGANFGHPPALVFLPPGTHKVFITATNAPNKTRSVDVMEGQRASVEIHFTGASPETATSGPSPTVSASPASLPGYGLSFRPGQRLVPVKDIADCFAKLMTNVLGYERFCAQGGDIGSWVSSRMAAVHPDKLVGIHLNLLVYRTNYDTNPPAPADPSEEEFVQQLKRWRQEEGGYLHIQGTRPQTLAYGLTDSPAGLAAWIMEKFRSWSDCNGDLESIFPLDHLLADISLYWLTGAIFSSFGPYHDRMYNPSTIERVIDVPTGYCEFPRESLRSPRSFAVDVCHRANSARLGRESSGSRDRRLAGFEGIPEFRVGSGHRRTARPDSSTFRW